MKTADIQIRDPFICPCPDTKRYYLFGTTDKNCWEGPGTGFNCYHSHDLENWEGPFPAFRPPPGFWATQNFWAPEVHRYQDKYYMLATFVGKNCYRGTQILKSDDIAGPYRPLTEFPVTPPDWQCLDGTLYVEEDGKPWMVFCHEWTQIHNGAMIAMPLSADLSCAAGRPLYLFSASEAPWGLRPGWPEAGASRRFPDFVTDGPFLHRLKNGILLMLWSSYGEKGYVMGIARSESGNITGPWVQQAEPLWAEDGGHGMLFRTFDQKLMLSFHHPNQTPEERPFFVEVEETTDSLRIRS